jgi:predicted nucleic acid-binding protein
VVAADTSTLIAYFADMPGEDVELLDQALAAGVLFLPPVVLCEILSDPKLSESARRIFLKIPLLEVRPGFWERAGDSRAKLIAKGLKARLADTLIAQSCLDNDAALITRDRDFKGFAKICGLELP